MLLKARSVAAFLVFVLSLVVSAGSAAVQQEDTPLETTTTTWNLRAGHRQLGKDNVQVLTRLPENAPPLQMCHGPCQHDEHVSSQGCLGKCST